MNEEVSMAVSREIASLVSTPGIDIIYLPIVGSTNTYLKELALNGAKERTVVIAGSQTGGRGRMGRSFYSPADSGLYMSILLRPRCPVSLAVGITSMTAVSVAEALENVFPVKAGIKWVNDIYLDSKKVCGILTEGEVNGETGLFSYVIVGIGINLLTPDGGFPEDLSNIAGSVAAGEGTASLRFKTAAAVLDSFFKLFDTGEANSVLDEYRRRCITLGQDVNILSQDKIIDTGHAVDVDPDFALVVRTESGEIKRINSGEVSIRPVVK